MSGQAPSPSATILCVEDEADLRDDLACELREAGYQVVEAGDGLAALAAIESAVQSGGIDLILCDVQLPGMDGIGVLRRLRELGEGRLPIPFALLTAFSDSALRAEAQSLEVSGLIVKPIDYDDLLELIPSLLQGSPQAA